MEVVIEVSVTAFFWIEKIRVNAEYDIFGYHPTQAEIIAVLLFLIGRAPCLAQCLKSKHLLRTNLS